MKRFLTIVATSFVLISCGSIQKYNKKITSEIPIEDLRDDIDDVYFQLQKHHPKLYQYISKERLDFKIDSVKNSISEPLNSKQFYKKLAPVIKTIGQGHISVIPPQLKQERRVRKEYRDKKFNFGTLDFDYIEQHLLITAAKDVDTLLIGSEVVEINGETPQQLIAAYNKNIASDGYNKTLFQTFVASRFQRFYYRDKGFQDSLNVTFKNKDSIFSKVFKWKEKEKPEDKIVDSVVKVKEIKITKEDRRIKRKEQKVKRKFDRDHGLVFGTDKYKRNFNFIGKDSTVAYMKIRGFSDGPFETFYEESFMKMDSLKTENLIIDLRDNGGGRLTEINELYSYLIDKEYTFINESEVNSRTPMLSFILANGSPFILKGIGVVLSPFIAVHNLIKTTKRDDKIYYRFKQSKLQQPKENPYKGNVYVLINGNSFSASSIISTHLKATNRATFVGQETGGAYNGTVAGVFKNYKLPHSNIRVNMGLMQMEAPYKIEPNGYGVLPDVEIKSSLVDFENKKDAAIDWVLNSIDKTN